MEGRLLMTLHIYVTPPTRIERRRLKCPTCKRVTRFVTLMFEWHDPESICCACGERWQGAEMCTRPFERGWRKRSMARAEQHWKEASLAGTTRW